MKEALRAHADAHNAELADPIERERAEAHRLADILRERYAGPGIVQFIGLHPEAWHQVSQMAPDEIGDYKANRLGWWKIPQSMDWPCDIQSVEDALCCILHCEASQEVNVALYHGKRLVALLREAQTQCDEEPEPVELSLLSTQSQVATLEALAELEAAVQMKQLGTKTALSDKSIRLALKTLVQHGFARKTGNGGSTSYQITQVGRRCAAWSVLHPYRFSTG